MIKVKVLRHLPGVFTQYQPNIGQIYDAEYYRETRPNRKVYPPTCVITIGDKKICLRPDEYEICGGTGNG